MNPHPSTPSGRLRLRVASFTRTLPAVLALAALASPDRSLAQAPTFNTLLTTPTGSAPWNPPSSAAVGDFNGDGKLDAIISDGSQSLRLMLGNGNGTFTQLNIGVPGAAPGMIRAADLNGDGRLDAVFVSPQGNLAPTVVLNTGNDTNGVPQFTVTTYTPVYSGLRSVTVGDLNGDGRPDFIVGNAYGWLQVYLNNGNGTFSGQPFFNLVPNVGGSTGPGAIADVNGDGKADYIVTSNQAGAIDVFFGNGNGTFQAPVVIPSSTTSLAVADVNGDGKPDLLAVANGAPNQLLVYLNTGNGTFSAPTPYPTGGTAWNGWTALATADLNGDGKLDVVVTNSGNNKVAVFLGDGSGTFGVPTLLAVNLIPLDVAVRDFTGDGKPDIATVGAGGYGGNTYGVLTNTTPAPAPAPLFFADSLATDSTSPNVTIPAGKYAKISSGLQRSQSSSSVDRPFVKTNANGYLTAPNFTAEISVKLATNDLAFFGLGQGDTDATYSNEPGHAFYFRAHNAFGGTSRIDAAVRSSGGTFLALNAALGNYVNGSTVTLRIVRAGNNVTMSIVGGSSVTYSLPAYSALGLTNTNTRVFFGNTSVGSVFSNLKIYEALPDTTPPVITAPADIVQEATGPGGNVVTFTATAVDEVDGPVPVVASPASGSTFPIATTVVGLAASDAAGNTSTASFTVTVRDTTAPAIASATPSTAALWPANHKMVAVTIAASASDAVGVTSLKIIGVTSSEPDNGLGDGDTAGDIQITGPLTLNLRAERSGTGSGRTYTITVEARDAAGNASTKICTVAVPKSQGK